jgi:hypothetical protein
LRKRNLASVLQVLIAAPGDDTYILFAQKPGSQNGGAGIVRDVFVLAIDGHGHNRLVVPGVESDIRYTTDAHAGHGDGGLDLETADILEFRRDHVGVGHVRAAQIAHAKGQHCHRQQTAGNKYADP